jgi:hypothetical protein
MREERFIDNAIRKVLGRQTAGTASACPDENLLAAYLERSLSDQEMSRLENHVSQCAPCLELLALSMKTSDGEPLQAPGMPASRERKSLSRFSVPLAAIAVLVIGVGVATLFLLTREFRKPERIEVARQMPPAAAPAASEMQRARPESSTAPVEPAKPSGSSLTPARVSGMRGATDRMTRAKDKEAGAQGQSVSAEYAHVPGPEGELSKADRIASNEAANRPAAWKDESETGAATAQAGGGAVGGVVGGILLPARPAEEPAAREGAPQAAVVAEDSGAAKVQAREREARLAMKSQRASLSTAPIAAEESRLRDAIRRVAADEKAGKRSGSTTRTVGGRIFALNGGFWVDLKCIADPDAGLAEFKEGSAGFDDVLKAVPGLDELRREGLPILLDWNGRICMIR